ncbi:MAG: spore cortex-lytic enzyme [Clostridia bacterium]|nr:spore cortex-lytic enzyme [Clostridia bacterium]
MKRSHTKLYRLWQILVILLINLLIITLVFSSSADALSRMGSTGSEVREIQTRLKKWGYYSGSVDGIYGTRTKNAVIYFQRKNGLRVDGIAGPATLAAMGIRSSQNDTGYSTNDFNLLARLISAEARGEPYVGQVAVGAVVLNRVSHASFPNSISGVIYQDGAFTCLYDGQFWKTVADSAYKAARDALNGWDPSGGAIYYYNPVTSTNSWIYSRPIITTIGKHRFCR